MLLKKKIIIINSAKLQIKKNINLVCKKLYSACSRKKIAVTLLVWSQDNPFFQI
jgi:hypothetical protein